VVQTSDAQRPSNKLLLSLSSHFGKFGRPRSRTRSSIDVNVTYCSFEGIVHIMRMFELWGDMMKPRREPAISVAMIIRRVNEKDVNFQLYEGVA
jgi:hypothetical protein